MGNDEEQACGIIYCHTRASCEEISAFLNSRGLKAAGGELSFSHEIYYIMYTTYML